MIMNVYEDIFFTSVSAGDLYLPEQVSGDAVVLLIHGGGWCSMDKKDVRGIAEFLCGEIGLPVFNINYRLTRESPWPACGDDCLSAANFLLDGKLPGVLCKKLLVVGVSAGGHLALMTGLRLPREKAAGIVSISGIADMEPDCKLAPCRYKEFFGREDFSKEDLLAASAMGLLSADAPPVFCTHDIDDVVVPFGSVKNFQEAGHAIGMDISLYAYQRPGDEWSHHIWIPGSEPHKLYRDLEEKIAGFIAGKC